MTRDTFISHRHDDGKIAETIVDFLHKAGVNPIHCSSIAGSGPKIGEVLPDDLRTRLRQTKLVILIYTFADLD